MTEYISTGLHSGDLLARMFRRAEKQEQAIELKGTFEGKPFLVIVAVGAKAGLLEKYARAGTLLLTPED